MQFQCHYCCFVSQYGTTWLKLKKLGWKYMRWNTGMAPAGRKEIWACPDCVKEKWYKESIKFEESP